MSLKWLTVIRRQRRVRQVLPLGLRLVKLNAYTYVIKIMFASRILTYEIMVLSKSCWPTIEALRFTK